MKTAIIFLENGDFWSTLINGTEEEARDYYMGQPFNVATIEEVTKGIVKMSKCIKVEVK